MTAMLLQLLLLLLLQPGMLLHAAVMTDTLVAVTQVPMLP